MAETAYVTYKANDGEQLAYQRFGSFGPSSNSILILLHGFTGSSRYFERNFEQLSDYYLVIAPDLRGHGVSSKARHGYHVARLATDLHDLLTTELEDKYPDARYIGIGCSLGAAVLWTYSELFSSKGFQGMIFVDQAPLQDYIPGNWSISQGNYSVHDATSLAMAQATLSYAPDEVYRGLAQGCLGYRFLPTDEEKLRSPETVQKEEEFFVNISRQGEPWWFGKLLANHTSYDHRDTIRNSVRCPCLVLAAKRSGSFPLDGLLETERLINEGRAKIMAQSKVSSSGHCKYPSHALRCGQSNILQGCSLKNQTFSTPRY
jgi:pimeloyl-ACP methyl ester carboxylesterase